MEASSASACSACGRRTVWDSAKQELVCLSCGAESPMAATNGKPSAEEGDRQRLTKVLRRLAIMCAAAAVILFVPSLIVYWPRDRLDIVWAYMTFDQRPTYWYQFCVPLASLLAVAGAFLLFFGRPLARLFRSFGMGGN